MAEAEKVSQAVEALRTLARQGVKRKLTEIYPTVPSRKELHDFFLQSLHVLVNPRGVSDFGPVGRVRRDERGIGGMVSFGQSVMAGKRNVGLSSSRKPQSLYGDRPTQLAYPGEPARDDGHIAFILCLMSRLCRILFPALAEDMWLKCFPVGSNHHPPWYTCGQRIDRTIVDHGVIGYNLGNTDHTDLDASESFSLFVSNDTVTDSRRSWLLFFPNVLLKGTSKCFAIRLGNGVYVKWDGRLLRHATSALPPSAACAKKFSPFVSVPQNLHLWRTRTKCHPGQRGDLQICHQGSTGGVRSSSSHAAKLKHSEVFKIQAARDKQEERAFHGEAYALSLVSVRDRPECVHLQGVSLHPYDIKVPVEPHTHEILPDGSLCKLEGDDAQRREWYGYMLRESFKKGGPGKANRGRAKDMRTRKEGGKLEPLAVVRLEENEGSFKHTRILDPMVKRFEISIKTHDGKLTSVVCGSLPLL